MVAVAIRIDTGTLRPAKRLPGGGLRADAAITRTGVFEYRNPDGTVRREYRPDAEVFKPESLESFAGVPVTDDHPPGLLTAKNAREYARGSVGENIRRDGDHVVASLSVFDADTIAKMDGGKSQVSCGYECDLDETPGQTPDGKRYDAVQRNIRGNHLAIVHAARAGSTARVRLDGASEMTDTLTESTMDLEKLTLELAAATARADAADASIKELELKLAAAESKAAKVTELDKARADAAEQFTAAVAARVELERAAADILTGVKLAGMTDRAIKCAVVKAVEKTDVDAKRSDDYVQARFDAAMERAAGATAALGALRADGAFPGAAPPFGSKPAGDEEMTDEEKARKKMEDESANAWKTKGSK